MFVSPAFAQATDGAAGGPGALEALLPIILIFVVFYFLLIRPQQKRMKQHKEMLDAIRRGDRVVTGGGIIGTVIKVVDDTEVQLEIAEGVRVRVQRSMISSVVAKTEPVSPTKDKEGDGSTAKDVTPTEDKPAAEKPSRLRKILGGKSD